MAEQKYFGKSLNELRDAFKKNIERKREHAEQLSKSYNAKYIAL